MNTERQIVVVARVLLPAGRDRLADLYELREGGLDATREDLLAVVPGASALIADPSLAIDADVLDAAGEGLRTSPSATTTSTSRPAVSAGWS